MFLAGHKIDEWDGAKIDGTEGYFQDLWFGEGKFHFGTRWVPDFETLMNVADRFKVGFEVDYSDPSMSLYGKGMYAKHIMVDVRLDIDDYNKIKYDQKADNYEYQNKRYRALERPALEVLRDKIKALAAISNSRD